MQDRDKNIMASLREMLRYLKGEMKGKERNSFERELQKDPFAGEAEEGFELITAQQASEDIEHLQKLMKKRTQGKRTGTGYRIAAAIAVLMIISSVFIVIKKQNKPSEQVAMMEKPEILEIDRSSPLQAPEESKPDKSIKEPSKRQRSVENKNEINTEQNSRQKENFSAPGNQPVVYDNIAARAARARDEEQMKVQSDAVPSATESKSRGISTAAASFQQGYQPPHPVTGEQAFEKYISENIRRPDSSDQRVVVVIEFIVRTDGTPDSLKVVRSPGEKFSEEAMRLIRKGPEWEPAHQDGKPVVGKTSVKIVFP